MKHTLISDACQITCHVVQHTLLGLEACVSLYRTSLKSMNFHSVPK